MYRILLSLSVLSYSAYAFTIGNNFLEQSEGCVLNIQGKDIEPVVADNATKKILYPSSKGIILQKGDTVRIGCPGAQISTLNEESVYATCVSGSQLKTNEDSLDFNTLSCTDNIVDTARYTGNECGNGGKQIEIGFDLGKNFFVREVEVCFDNVNYNAIYSHHLVTKLIHQHESGVKRPLFSQDDFYGGLKKSVNSLYVRGGQRATVNHQLGLSPKSTKYIKNGNTMFLARGHLTPKAAFVYAAEQSATFHYVNVAPQWQGFNGKNWAQVEADVRGYADAHDVDLEVYTGTYGHCTLPHAETGEEVPLYLYAYDDEKALAVPELYWKLAYEPISQKGVVLLGVNNPYISSVDEHVICEDVSEELNWLNWERDDISQGYSYACRVEDFVKKVNYLPKLKVSGLLV